MKRKRNEEEQERKRITHDPRPLIFDTNVLVFERRKDLEQALQ